MQLDQIETRLQSPLGGPGKRPDNRLYTRNVQRHGRSVVFRKRHCTGGHHVLPPAFTRGQIPLLRSPWARHAGFAPRVRQLHTSACTLPMKEGNDAFQPGDVIVLPQSQILRRNPPFGQHCRCLRKNQPRPTDGTASQVDQVPVIAESVLA